MSDLERYPLNIPSLSEAFSNFQHGMSNSNHRRSRLDHDDKRFNRDRDRDSRRDDDFRRDSGGSRGRSSRDSRLSCHARQGEKEAISLYSLIQDGKYRPTKLGRDELKKLIGSQASLQPNCEREGFNVLSGNTASSKARIGIVGNNEKDCITSDSRIGFGTGGYPDYTNSCGNVAQHGGDSGDEFIKAMGYIFV